MSISALGASQYQPALIAAPITTTITPATGGIQSTASVQTGTAAVATHAASQGGQSSSNALLKALQQTLSQYGLTGTKTASSTSSTSNSTTASQASVTNLNTTQAVQTFLGALYQTLAQAPTQGTASTATNGAAATTSAATAAAGTAASTATPGIVTNAANTNSNGTGAGTNTEAGTNSNSGTTGTTATTPYNDTGANLAALLQQLQSGSSNTASLTNSSTSTSATGSLAVLQSDYQNLLNTASPISSQAAANGAAPTLQTFLQSLAQNFATDTNAPSTKINAIGSLVETSA